MTKCLPCNNSSNSPRRKKVKKTTYVNEEWSSASVMPNKDNQRSRVTNIRTKK